MTVASTVPTKKAFLAGPSDSMADFDSGLPSLRLLPSAIEKLIAPATEAAVTDSSANCLRLSFSCNLSAVDKVCSVNSSLENPEASMPLSSLTISSVPKIPKS